MVNVTIFADKCHRGLVTRLFWTHTFETLNRDVHGDDARGSTRGGSLIARSCFLRASRRRGKQKSESEEAALVQRGSIGSHCVLR